MDAANAVHPIVSIIAANTGTSVSEIVWTAIAVKSQRAHTATQIQTSLIGTAGHKSKPP